MRRRLLSVVCTLIMSVFCLSAQSADDSDWFWNKNISKIEFQGLNNVKKSELIAISDSFTNIPFTEDNYNNLLDRLYAMDLFEEIEPYAEKDPRNENNVVVIVNVVEHPVIVSITFNGNQKIRNSELRELIKTKTSDVFIESKILLDERLIRDHYIQKGYADSKVTHKIEKTDSGVKIVFNINEGANTVISNISITGNTIIAERNLKSKLTLKPVGFMKDGAYQVSALELDKRRIISFYQEKGYIDAAILDVKIDTTFNKEKDRNELSITFVIQEGSKYTFKGISFSGNQIFTESELKEKMKLYSGDTFNAIKFQEGLEGIQGLYVDNGYMNCRINPVPTKNTETKEILYKLDIIEGQRSHVENVIIRGNNKTKDYVIRREFPVEEGDIFSRDKIISGIRNLHNLQFFSTVLPDVKPGSEQNLVDVIVDVEEQGTIGLNFGMTFSGVSDPDDIPISLFLKVDNINLFGEGKALSLSTTLAKTEQSIDFSYGQTWIKDLPISYSQSISFSHKESQTPINMFNPSLTLDQYYYYTKYEGYSFSIGTAFGRRWYRDDMIISLSGGMSNSLTKYIYDENIYTTTDLGITTFANRWGLMNTLYSSVSFDGRDNRVDPSKGWFASERLAWNGLIPGLEKEFFLRSDTKGEYYYTLCDIPVTETFNFKCTLAANTTLSLLTPVNSTISDSNKLYVDGIFNGRGWTNIYKTKESKGQTMWNTSLELRVPIVPNILGIDIFHDAVAVKPDFNSMVSDLSIQDFYFSFGPGIKMLIQQFPLHLLFAFKYQYDDNGIKMADNPFQLVLSFNIINQ